MTSQEKTKSHAPVKRPILKIALLVVVVLVAGLVLAIPAYLSSQSGQKLILQKLNQSIPGKTEFSNLSMGWLAGIKITDLKFNNSAGTTSLTAKQLTVRPRYLSLLAGRLSLGKTVIDQPNVAIKLPPAPLPTPVPPQPAKPAEQPLPTPQKQKPAKMALPIGSINLLVKNGDVKITAPQGQTVQFADINSKINLRPPGRQTSFDINMVVKDQTSRSTISAEGLLRPSTQKCWSFAGTTGSLDIDVNKLDIASLAPLLALAKVDLQAQGQLSADFQTQIKQGSIDALEGKITGSNIDIAGPALKGDRIKTAKLDAEVKLARQKELVNIELLRLNTDWLDANMSGTVPTTIAAMKKFLDADTAYSLKGKFSADLGRIMSQMSRTLALRQGTAITSGRLTANLDTLTQPGQKRFTAQVTVSALAGTVDGQPITLAEPVRTEADIVSDKQTIRFDKLNFSSGFGRASCTGTTRQLKYNADIDLGKFQAQLGRLVDIGPYTLAGIVNAAGQVTGEKNKTSVAGSASAQNFAVTSGTAAATEPKADISYSLAVDKNNETIDIEQLNATGSFGQISTKNANLPLGAGSKAAMNLPLSANVDLAAVRPFLVVFADFPPDLHLAGQAQSQLDITGRDRVYRLVTDATEIRNLKLTYPGQQPFIQDLVTVRFDVELDTAQKLINVRRLELISPQIKIKGNLQQSNQAGQVNLKGQADLDYDWAALSTITAPYLPQGFRLEGKRKDSISFTASYPAGQPDKLIQNLTTNARLGFDRAQFYGLLFGQTDIDLAVSNGLLQIHPFSTTVNNGRFNFASNADFKQKPTLLRTPGAMTILKGVQLNDVISQAILKNVNPVFANAANVTGTANLDCRSFALPLAGGSKNDIEIIGTVSIDDLRLQASDLLGQILTVIGSGGGVPTIKIHPTDFALQQGFLRYDNMQMDIGQAPVNFAGVIGLDKSLDMKVTLPYTTAGKTVRIGRETEGARVVLPLKGTVDKPELDLGGLLQEQLKQQFEEQIKKGLEKLLK